jgi:hypothetical protein
MSSLEFRLTFDSALDDAPMSDPEVADAVERLFETARLGAELARTPGVGFSRAESLREEIAVIDARYRAGCAKLVQEAEKKTPPEPPASNELKKRFGGSEKTVFRKFFAEQRARGQSVPQILNKFTDAARREFADILQELCEEFAAAA